MWVLVWGYSPQFTSKQCYSQTDKTVDTINQISGMYVILQEQS